MKRQRKELKGLGKEGKTRDEIEDRADDRIVDALFPTKDTPGVRSRNDAVATRKNSTLARITTPIVLGHPSLGRTEENQTKRKRDNQKGNILEERIVVCEFPQVLQQMHRHFTQTTYTKKKKLNTHYCRRCSNLHVK
jgi:hypothetical protein